MVYNIANCNINIFFLFGNIYNHKITIIIKTDFIGIISNSSISSKTKKKFNLRASYKRYFYFFLCEEILFDAVVEKNLYKKKILKINLLIIFYLNKSC